ncbi:hypothetical protein WH299_03310 [Pseudomonas sp. MYb541]|uniref:hypothetical protein n=1 Tax=Pseudomonas sp. MYb541 TaxID=2745402 RepID=UPI0030A90376
MGLGKNQLAIVRETLMERFVYSACPLVLSEALAKSKPTTIFADQIIVDTLASSDGQNVNLVCRELIFKQGGKINLDGLPGVPTFPAEQRPEAQHTAGADGPDGDDGGHGVSAGTLSITTGVIIGQVSISARGGAGGRPRDGGHGRQGGTGAKGRSDTVRRRDEYPPSATGGTGLPGGKAGLPGYRGRGGDGGMVHIVCLDQIALQPGEVDVTHGLHGGVGIPGNPGSGGAGGQGGDLSFIYCEPRDRAPKLVGYISEEVFEADTQESLLLRSGVAFQKLTITSPHPDFCYKEFSHYGHDGQVGAEGDTRLAELAVRQANPLGKEGVLKVEQCTEIDFAKKFDGVILDLLACATEDEYRCAGNAVTDLLRIKIEFLLSVCTSDPTPSRIKLEVCARAYSMAQKISVGLDFFGFSREHAPLLAFDTYSRLVEKTFLPQATIIEESFNRYWSAYESVEQRREELRKVVAGAKFTIDGLEREYKRATAEATSLVLQIPALDLKVAAAEKVLRLAEASLTKAINKKNSGCDLIKTLTAVSTIVVGVYTGGAGFLAAGKAGIQLLDDFKANNDSLATLWDSKNVFAAGLKDLNKGVTDTKSGIESIQKGMTQLDQNRLRVPQFTMERENFDRVARDFAEMPEAAEYKEAGYDFLKSVEARNQAILDYNGILFQLIEMQARVAASQRSLAVIDTVLTGTVDPSEGHIMGVMTRLYIDTLALAAQMVHSEKKALNYHFARPDDAPLSALNVATIAFAHQKILGEDWVSAKERYDARRELTPGRLELDLQKLVSNVSWENFKKTMALSFTIRAEQSDYSALWGALAGVRITGMELILDGAKVANGQEHIPWDMTHCGTEIIYRKNGLAVPFTHRAITFTGITSVSGGPSILDSDFSEKDLYAGLSPFASWLLIFSRDTNLKLDLNSLKSAKLRLSGYMVQG